MTRWIAAIAIMMVWVGFSSLTTSSQGATQSVTIHASECPAGYTGDDLFNDCHGESLAGVVFSWLVLAPGEAQSVTTDKNGVATITTSGLGLGLSIVEQPPFELEEFAVVCSSDDGAVSVPVTYDSTQTGVVIADDNPDAEIVCDWYNIPAGESAPGDPVTLPDTGVGSAHPSTDFATRAIIALTASLMLLLLGARELAKRPGKR